MKILHFGRLVYIQHGEHEALVAMNTFNEEPIADLVFDDGFFEEPECSISAKNGHTMKVAVKLAMSELRLRDRMDRGLPMDHD